MRVGKHYHTTEYYSRFNLSLFKTLKFKPVKSLFLLRTFFLILLMISTCTAHCIEEYRWNTAKYINYYTKVFSSKFTAYLLKQKCWIFICAVYFDRYIDADVCTTGTWCQALWMASSSSGIFTPATKRKLSPWCQHGSCPAASPRPATLSVSNYFPSIYFF